MHAAVKSPVRLPPPLRPGSRVGVVAGSSPLPRTGFFTGLGWLRERYRVQVSKSVLARAGYLAGDDALRRDALQAMLNDPGLDAIVAGRGGYGLTRILGRLDWRTFRERPKWLVGFSDVTALLIEGLAQGVGSVHGSNVTGLGVAHAADRLQWLHCLEGKPRAAWKGERVLHAGQAQGPLFGGNLALLQALAAEGRLVAPRGAVWLIEDVTERPYRLDRMLTSLRPQLATASALVFGEMALCEPGPDGVSAEQALASVVDALPIPVVFGAPFGHGERNAPFVLGTAAHLDARDTSWTLRFE